MTFDDRLADSAAVIAIVSVGLIYHRILLDDHKINGALIRVATALRVGFYEQ